MNNLANFLYLMSLGTQLSFNPLIATIDLNLQLTTLMNRALNRTATRLSTTSLQSAINLYANVLGRFEQTLTQLVSNMATNTGLPIRIYLLNILNGLSLHSRTIYPREMNVFPDHAFSGDYIQSENFIDLIRESLERQSNEYSPLTEAQSETKEAYENFIENHESLRSETYDTDIPSEYLCPITQDLMIEPVRSIYGYHFEKAAITFWIEKERTCPLSRQNLNHEQFEEDHELKRAIIAWREEHCTHEDHTSATPSPS